MHHTVGHTPGSTSCTLPECDKLLKVRAWHFLVGITNAVTVGKGSSFEGPTKSMQRYLNTLGGCAGPSVAYPVELFHTGSQLIIV